MGVESNNLYQIKNSNFCKNIYKLVGGEEMSLFLLQKIRRINKLLQKTGFQPVMFNDICQVVSDGIDSNVMIFSKKGKLLGVSTNDDYGILNQFGNLTVGDYLEEMINKKLLNFIETQDNIKIQDLGMEEDSEYGNDFNIVVTPIEAGGEKIGTLVTYKNHAEFDVEDVIIIEYAGTVIGLEIIRSMNEENAEEIRKTTIVKSAIGTLSYSELEAILHIFEELEGREGLLVASKIADRVGITRSVIVNALRKFESAGVIESRSLGMKGTFIKVLNDVLIEELDKLRK